MRLLLLSVTLATIAALSIGSIGAAFASGIAAPEILIGLVAP
jgi:hypothetical protein